MHLNQIGGSLRGEPRFLPCELRAGFAPSLPRPARRSQPPGALANARLTFDRLAGVQTWALASQPLLQGYGATSASAGGQGGDQGLEQSCAWRTGSGSREELGSAQLDLGRRPPSLRGAWWLPSGRRRGSWQDGGQSTLSGSNPVPPSPRPRCLRGSVTAPPWGAVDTVILPLMRPGSRGPWGRGP